MKPSNLFVFSKMKINSDTKSAIAATKKPTKHIGRGLIEPKSSISSLKSIKNLKKYGKAATITKRQQYLELNVVKEMLGRFLFEKKMSKKSLAESISITTKELDQLLSVEDVTVITQLIKKVTLPLVKLYCESKWPPKL